MSRIRNIAVIAGLSLLASQFVAVQAHAAEAPTLNLCTASSKGVYWSTAGKLAGKLQGQVKINPIETNGSEDNLRRLAEGSCDAAFVQNDAQLKFAKENPGASLNIEPVATMYPEYAHLVCNRDSGIDAIKDFYGTKKTIIIGKPGSGSATTWYGFGVAEKRYQPLSTLDVEGAVATTRLINGKADCMLFVAGLNSVKMQEINALGKGKLKLVKLNDGDLDNARDANKNPIYRYDTIPSGTYGNLQDGTFSSSVKTIVVDSVLVANNAWIEKNNQGYSDLSTAAIRLSQQLSK
jgi:TRAP transporter TAXI family solute receptor